MREVERTEPLPVPVFVGDGLGVAVTVGVGVGDGVDEGEGDGEGEGELDISTSHSLTWLFAGSPKMELLQGMLPVAVFVTQLEPIPYRTVWVPLKVQVPFSSAHFTQLDPVEGLPC